MSLDGFDRALLAVTVITIGGHLLSTRVSFSEGTGILTLRKGFGVHQVDVNNSIVIKSRGRYALVNINSQLGTAYVVDRKGDLEKGDLWDYKSGVLIQKNALIPV